MERRYNYGDAYRRPAQYTSYVNSPGCTDSYGYVDNRAYRNQERVYSQGNSQHHPRTSYVYNDGQNYTDSTCLPRERVTNITYKMNPTSHVTYDNFPLRSNSHYYNDESCVYDDDRYCGSTRALSRSNRYGDVLPGSAYFGPYSREHYTSANRRSFNGPYSSEHYNSEYPDMYRSGNRCLSRNYSRGFSRYDDYDSSSDDEDFDDCRSRASRHSRSRRRKIKKDWRHNREQKGRLLGEVQGEIQQLESEIQARRVQGERTRHMEEKVQNLYKLELDICKGM